jgi:hypothetical protein
MAGVSLHMQWPLTSQSRGSVSQREQLFFCYGSNSTANILFKNRPQATTWVTKKVGDRKLLIWIGVVGLLLALLIAGLNGAGQTTGSTTFNSCMGHTEAFEVTTFIKGYLHETRILCCAAKFGLYIHTYI